MSVGLEKLTLFDNCHFPIVAVLVYPLTVKSLGWEP